MSRELRIEVEALEELAEAAEWYEDKQRGRGEALVEAIEHTLDRVQELPLSFRLIMERPPVRRALVRKFPYAVVFITHADIIHVLAYAHVKRRPLYWAHRIAGQE